MPIALEGGNGIGQPGFARGIGCATIYEWPEILPAGRKLDPAAASDGAESSSCSSSIGKNSDRESESGGDDAGEGEAQSAPRGPLETMDALEESLPIRRGISNFYRGKSKSFTSLADVASSFFSAKDLAKPENAYTRKHRDLLALKNAWHRPHSSLLRSTGGGISKRPVSSNRSTFALVVAMCSSGSSTTNSEEECDRRSLLPPLHPASKPTAGFIPFGSSPPRRCTIPMRSFSLTDLQGISGSSFSIDDRDNHEGFS